MKTNDNILFLKIPNALIIDTDISPGAVRLYLYLHSKPDDWIFYNNHVKKSLGIGANETIAGYFKELINSGWISRKRKKKNGKFCGGYDCTMHLYQKIRGHKK